MIIYNFSENQIKQLIKLYKDTGWGERSIEDTVNCVQSSQICIGIIDQESNLIGFTRIITDFMYKALILDVMVNTDYRGTGLGKKLIHNVKNHEMLQKVKHFELYCLPEMEAFYSNYGFSTDVDGLKLMRSTNA
jgi:predicted GNAT family N-acyltransferase